MHRPGPTRVYFIAAAAALVGATVLAAQNTETFIALLEWVRVAGPIGWVAFAFAYLLGTLFMFPASFLQASAGFLLGPIGGFLVASLASVASGLVAFTLGRTVLREPIARRALRDPRFAEIDRAVGDGGAYLVALLRLSPLSPFNVLNYGLGLTRVTAAQFAVGTWVGSLPAMFLYSWIGSTVSTLADLAAGEAAGNATVQFVGLGCTAVATILVARFAQQALRRALHPAP